MKILHFITSLRTGGAERLVIDLVPRLREMGHVVDILVMDGTRCMFTEEAERRGLRINALAVGASSMHNPVLAFKLRRFIRNGKYDIVHSHNTPCQILAALACPKETALVTTEHNTTNRRRANALWLQMDKWMYNCYKAIIACGYDTADSLIQYIPQLSPKISVIQNGIDISAFQGALPSVDISERFKGKRIITMIAAFRPQKDHTTILKALSLLPKEYALVLAGTGETLEESHQFANQLGVSDRVFFTGARADVANIYAASDVAVQSTHYEGFGLSAVEAMASGCPLIASDVYGLRNTVGTGGILFPAGDAQALANTIQALCTNNSLRQATIKQGLNQAKIYDISKTAEGYNQVYTALCSCMY